MSDKPRKIKHLRFEYIDPDLPIKNPRVLKDLHFEYQIPEFARPDFKLPSEEDKEREWAMIRMLFSGSRLIDPEKVKAHTKGNKPMDEELFKRVEVNIEKFTRAAMELQVAVIDAEAQLKDARQKRADADKMLEIARLRWVEAEDTLEKARGRLNHHLDSVRGLNVSMPAPPDWGQNVYKVGDRDE